MHQRIIKKKKGLSHSEVWRRKNQASTVYMGGSGEGIELLDRLVMMIGRLGIDWDSSDGLVLKELCIELDGFIKGQCALISAQDAELNAAASNCKRMLDQAFKENRSSKYSLAVSKIKHEKLKKQIDELKNQLAEAKKQ